jgi:hypothetical protein
VGVTVPKRVLGYALVLTERLEQSLGGRLRAAYLHGSAVLGGWTPGRSDVDVLFVAEDGLGEPETAAAAAVLAAPEPACPGTGLECSVVTVSQAASPQPPWPFLLHVADAGSGGKPRIVSGSGHPGDPDLLMHYAVCREAGLPVSGPPAPDLIGSVPRPVILGYLAGELGWAAAHATEAYAVLNACRAMVFLADGRIVSKVAGGSIALDRGLGPRALLQRALDEQHGNAPRQPVTPEARDFVQSAAAALRSAASSECRTR